MRTAKINGVQKRGRAAMSSNVFPVSRNTPTRRAGSLIPFGWGSIALGGSGVISCLNRAENRPSLLMPRQIALILVLVLCGCKPTEESRMKAIIGAVLMDGSGGPPLTNSVVVTAGERIRAAGSASSVPIPADADKIDGS